MGYRSEVIFGVSKDSRDKMDKVLEEHNLQNSFKWYEKTYTWTRYDEPNEIRNHRFFDLNMKVKQTDYWIVWIGDYLKWYDEFEDVRAINECIDELEGKGFMVALGEDNVIHSERGEWYDYVEHICKLKIK